MSLRLKICFKDLSDQRSGGFPPSSPMFNERSGNYLGGFSRCIADEPGMMLKALVVRLL